MGRVARLIRRITNRLEGAALTSHVPATHVAEITPCLPRRDSWQGARLNLMLPSISKQHYFGGIHTAVLIYRELFKHFPASRIVLVDSIPDDEALSRFPDHELVQSEAVSSAPRQIVPFSDRYGRTLPVAAGDIWVATAWWTAYAAQRMARWQGENGGVESPLLYLIQDFEPGFYPWSSQYALALSTYRPDRDIAVFNTRLLADFFVRQGLSYLRYVAFEPVLHDRLREALNVLRDKEPVPRCRRIAIYARPSTPRNAFELICEGLRLWGWKDPRAGQWELVAAGELGEDVDLGPLKVRALGKLDIEGYATLLSTSAIGLSLMVSPHPSYPPLEMAAFGMEVLTNRYENKRLDEGIANITSTVAMTPEAICDGLVALVGSCEARGMLPAPLASVEHSLMADAGLNEVALAALEALAEASGQQVAELGNHCEN